MPAAQVLELREAALAQPAQRHARCARRGGTCTTIVRGRVQLGERARQQRQRDVRRAARGARCASSCGSRTSSSTWSSPRARSVLQLARRRSRPLPARADRRLAGRARRTPRSPPARGCVGCSPHIGQRGILAQRAARESASSSASYSSSRPDQRLADAEQQLDRLGRLDRADHARQHAEHAALGARRHQRPAAAAPGTGSGSTGPRAASNTLAWPSKRRMLPYTLGLPSSTHASFTR